MISGYVNEEIRKERKRAWEKHGNLPDNRSVCLNIITNQLGQAASISVRSDDLDVDEIILLRKKLIKIASVTLSIIELIDFGAKDKNLHVYKTAQQIREMRNTKEELDE